MRLIRHQSNTFNIAIGPDNTLVHIPGHAPIWSRDHRGHPDIDPCAACLPQKATRLPARADCVISRQSNSKEEEPKTPMWVQRRFVRSKHLGLLPTAIFHLYCPDCSLRSFIAYTLAHPWETPQHALHTALLRTYKAGSPLNRNNPSTLEHLHALRLQQDAVKGVKGEDSPLSPAARPHQH